MPAQTTPLAASFQRSPRTVWRLASDRVLIRRVDSEDPIAEDLFGAAARVWVAADEPRDVSDLAHETDLDIDVVEQALDLLVDHRWIEQVG